MRITKTLPLLLLVLTMGANSYAQKAKKAPKDGKHFGMLIDEKGTITAAELVTKMQGKDEMKTKIEAKAVSVCQAKGCWMKLETTATDEPMMVRFKDYAFFMPKDLSGKTVVCEGVAKRKTTSVEELRHYAEDAGKSAAEIAKITAPKNEIVFEASGVVIKGK